MIRNATDRVTSLIGLGGGGTAGPVTGTPASAEAIGSLPTIAPIAPIAAPEGATLAGATPAPPILGSLAFDPGGDASARLAALEAATLLLADNLDSLPAIDRLLGIEADIRLLLDQLALLIDEPLPSTVAPLVVETPPASAQPVDSSELPPIEGESAVPPVATAPPEPLVPLPLEVLEAVAAAQPSASPPAPAATATAPTPAAQPAVQPAGPQSGIHLASYRDPAGAERGWGILQATHQDVLGGLGHRATEVTLGSRGTFYRLVAGPFANARAAAAACISLSARGDFCEVVEY